MVTLRRRWQTVLPFSLPASPSVSTLCCLPSRRRLPPSPSPSPYCTSPALQPLSCAPAMAEEKYNLKNPAVKRILQEVKEMQSNPSDDFMSLPLEENIFEWQFAIIGPRDTEFEGGIYHGRIQLPAEYPFQPPAFMLLTPNGRFETQTKICLSISNHHPEHWQPSWSVRTALVALIAFMPTNPEGALGSLDFTKEERRSLAIKSCETPPKFGSAERQKLIDEIHQYMLSKVPPVPKLSTVPLLGEITSNGEGEPDASPETVSAAAAIEEHPEPEPEAEPVVVEDVREVRMNANYGPLQIRAGIKLSRSTPAAGTSEPQSQPQRPAARARTPVDDRVFTWAAIGLTIAILVLIVKKLLRANGYAGFMDGSSLSE